MKLSRSETEVLNAVRNHASLPVHFRTGKPLIRHKKAIVSLKRKKLIFKDEDNTLQLVEKRRGRMKPVVEESNEPVIGFSNTELMLIRSAVWDYINGEANLQPTWAIGSEIVRKIKIALS